MPNTKEVEQEAESIFPTPENPDARSLRNIDVVNNCRSSFIAGYNYALSNPLEQSENDQLKRKLEFYRNETAKIRDYVFDDSNKCGYPNQSIFEAITDKIDSLKAENDKLKSVEQSEKKEEWVSVEKYNQLKDQFEKIATEYDNIVSHHGGVSKGVTKKKLIKQAGIYSDNPPKNLV